MKKLILSISFICYLAMTCGIIVNFHYCMNRLASLQFFVTENTTCPKCGMHIEKSHGCCRDEVKIVKMEIAQKSTPAIAFELPSLDAIVQLPSQYLDSPFFNAEASRHYQNHSPPLLSEQDTYLENRVFRI